MSQLLKDLRAAYNGTQESWVKETAHARRYIAALEAEVSELQKVEDERDELRERLTEIFTTGRRFEGSQWVDVPLDVIERAWAFVNDTDSLSLWEETET